MMLLNVDVFAGAVAPEKCDDFVFANAKRNIVQHVTLAVERIDRFDLDDRCRRDAGALDICRRRPNRTVAEIVRSVQLR
jgi:hypothetical protein